jgi:hypothetical protein
MVIISALCHIKIKLLALTSFQNYKTFFFFASLNKLERMPVASVVKLSLIFARKTKNGTPLG